MPNRTAKSLVKNFLARRGWAMVRVPPCGAAKHAPAPGGAFFPTDEFFAAAPSPPLWNLPPELQSPSMPWQRVLAALYREPAAWPASIVPEGGLLLHALVRNIRPATIIEIGSCLGASSIWMGAACNAVGRGTMHLFDDFNTLPEDPRLRAAPIFQDRRRTVEQRLREAGVADRARFHEGDSKRTVPAAYDQLRAAGGVQLAFIDGDHSIAGVTADLLAVEPVLQVGGYVLLHDTFPDVCAQPGPRHLIDHLHEVARGRYQVCELYTAQLNYGMAILRRIA